MHPALLVIGVLVLVGLVVLVVASTWGTPGPPQVAQVNAGAPAETTLRTVNYNVFGRWWNTVGEEGQTARLTAIPAAIAANPLMGPSVDVITIEEAWCPDSQWITGRTMCAGNSSRTALTAAMAAHGWQYHSDVVDLPGASLTKKQTAGGAIVYSRWPIISTSQYVYQNCGGGDCHAAKGAVYVRIIKPDATGAPRAYNIIGTHLQAWSNPVGAKARAAQLAEIRDHFVPALGLPQDGSEPLIFQGDFNTDFVGYPEETEEVLSTLDAAMPRLVGPQLFSSNPGTNYLVGKDSLLT